MNPHAKAEWDAWQLVVKHWPGDINDPLFTPLVKAIQLWGEYLTALRLTQDKEIVTRAREQYRAQYASALAHQAPSTLRQAIDFAETIAPLPPCNHGSALADGGGERLEPPCGCRLTSSKALALDIAQGQNTGK